MILPPAAAHTGRSQPREQIFVIDSSGSMGGQSIVQAQGGAQGRARPARQRRSLQRHRLRLDDASLYAAPQNVHARRPTRRRCASSTAWSPTAAPRSAPRSTLALAQPTDRGLSAASHLPDGRRRRRARRRCSPRSSNASATRACSRSASARRRTRISCARRRSSAAAPTRTSATSRDVSREDDGAVREARARRAQRRRRRLARGRRALSARDPGRVRRRAARARGELSRRRPTGRC